MNAFWDGIVTSRSTVTDLRQQATILRNRPESERDQLTELAI